jgi:hypothetical protein
MGLRLGLKFTLIATLWLLPTSGQAQSAFLKGTTNESRNGVYTFLNGIEVTVYRDQALKSDTSKGMGNFNIEYPAGPPVLVLFKSPDGKLPELQSLSGAPGARHDVQVTVLTTTEAQNLNINIRAYINAIIDQLLAWGVKSEDKNIQDLRRLMAKFG